MTKLKFIAKPLKVTNDEVYMTIDQIKANSSLMVTDPATARQTCYFKLKDSRPVYSVVDYDDKLFISTQQLQDTLWQAIRRYQTLSMGGRKDLIDDCEMNSAKAFSVHNAVLKQNYPGAEPILSTYIAKTENLNILLGLINDTDLYQKRLKDCDEADKQSDHAEWLDVFGEKITKERLGNLLDRGSNFLFLDAITGDALRRPYLFYQAITSSLYASKLKGKSLFQAIEHVSRFSHFSWEEVNKVAEEMTI